jgi:hypothetical protein
LFCGSRREALAEYAADMLYEKLGLVVASFDWARRNMIGFKRVCFWVVIIWWRWFEEAKSRAAMGGRAMSFWR